MANNNTWTIFFVIIFRHTVKLKIRDSFKGYIKKISGKKDYRYPKYCQIQHPSKDKKYAD